MVDAAEPKEDAPVGRRLSAMRIVHRYALISAAAGVVPLPVIDVATLGAVHVALIKEITEYYGAEFSDHAARNILVAVGAGLIPGSIGSVVARRILRALPFVTPGLGLAAMSASSAAVSYALGTMFVRHFESGGTLDSFKVENLHRLVGWQPA